MRLGVVIFADLAVGIGAGRVEVAQGGEAQAVRLWYQRRIFSTVELGFAVGVHRALRWSSEMGTFGRLAVGGARDEKTMSRTPWSTIASSRFSVLTDVVVEILARVA